MSDTNISWCDKVWNATRGCRRISDGCGGANGAGGCYAERQAYRFSGPGQAYEGLVKLTANGPRWTGVGRFVPEMLAAPLRWKKPVRVFVDSMSDLFFDEFTNEQIAAVFGVMAACPQHTFQILTKRPQRMREWFEWVRGPFTEQQRGITAAPNTTRALLDAAFEFLGPQCKPRLDSVWRSDATDADAWPLPNVWLGVSVEHQAAADERIPWLTRVPAARHFLSCEPLLGPIDLRAVDGGVFDPAWLDWVIVGCESGPRARPCSVEWLRSLRDQCAAAGVAYFLKQATYTPNEYISAATLAIGADTGSKLKGGGVIELPYLDGVQHAAFPEVRR